MNRHNRRAAAAQERHVLSRDGTIRATVAYLAAAVATDPTVTGATVFTPRR